MARSLERFAIVPATTPGNSRPRSGGFSRAIPIVCPKSLIVSLNNSYLNSELACTVLACPVAKVEQGPAKAMLPYF